MSRHMRIGRIAVAAGVAASALLGGSGTALAAPAAAAAGQVLRPTSGQDTILEVSGPAPSGGFSLLVKKGTGAPGAAQRWSLVSAGPGVVTIENTAFGRLCVEVDPLPQVAVVAPAPCDGSAEQRWNVQPSTGGQRIRNAATGQVMAANPNPTLGFGLVFEEPPASSTVARLKQTWQVGA